MTLAFLLLAVMSGAETHDHSSNHERLDYGIEVIAVAPLPGLAIELHRHPTNVQTIEFSPTAEPLTRAIEKSLAGAQGADVQTNPFQQDLSIRGFLVSPLLGASQGIALYMDGVRLNETFGDTVNWDLLPTNALDSGQLFPGSNPIFGLNALGGALSIRTRDALGEKSTSAVIGGGSFGRWDVQADHSERAVDQSRGLLIAARASGEDGWRDHSPSKLLTLFGKTSHVLSRAVWDVSLNAADNELTGNGLAPVELLEQERDAVFTHPDRTTTRMGSLSTRWIESSTGDWSTELLGYLRQSRIRTLNGDDTPFEQCEDAEILCVEDSDEVVLDQSGAPVPSSDDDELDAVDNHTRSRLTTAGAALQRSGSTFVLGRELDTTFGGAIDAGSTDFRSSLELARLTESRGTDATGIFSLNDFVDLSVRSVTSSLFGLATHQTSERTAITGSLRAIYTTIDLNDRIGTELEGNHSFFRVNPSLGITWRPRSTVSFFANASQSSRTPTPVELTCADPDDPCRLPNSFVADPPLDDVVTHTLEAGLRRNSPGMRFSVAVFASRSQEDIIFVNSGRLTSEGHFENVSATRRHGLELSFDRIFARAGVGIRYAYTDATFDSSFFVSSPEHPFADEHRIAVEAGDRIPGIAMHSATASAWYRVTPSLLISSDLVAASDRYARGDEANLLEPISGHVRFDLTAQYAINDRWEVRADVTNALDAEYETFGVLGDAEEVLGEGYDNPVFISPGEPRAVRISLGWRR